MAKKRRKKRQNWTETQIYMLEQLMALWNEKGRRPGIRQIKKDNTLDFAEVLKVLGQGRGGTGVLQAMDCYRYEKYPAEYLRLEEPPSQWIRRKVEA